MKTHAPTLVLDDWKGRHNLCQTAMVRLEKAGAYKDLSTVCLVPTRGMIHARVVQSWMSLMPPMNQKFIRIFVLGMEVGAAYQTTVENILGNPELAKWKYLLTLEEDNMPPPDGLLKLCESIDGGVDGEKYDAMGGLYWTKGEGGQPMIYGDPAAFPMNFIPQIPRSETVQRCNGLGMGFTLFRLGLFKKMPKPWFKTMQEWVPGKGLGAFTQDLFFFNEAAKKGMRFACDTRVKVGHYDAEHDIVW